MFLGLRQVGESDESQVLRATTEFLQIIFNSFLHGNSYPSTKVIFLRMSLKEEKLLNYFPKLYPKDNYRTILPAKLLEC